MGATDKRPDGVDTRPADQYDLESYRQAAANLEEMRVPVLLHTGNPYERLYIAALDGTGNSKLDDKPKEWSAVARVYEQIQRTRPHNIASGYVEGTYTQQGILRTPERLLDGRYGNTFVDRVETAYFQLCEQARNWIDEEPNSRIRVAGIGYSRGAEEVAALERMIEERGIRDPIGAEITRDRGNENLITRIQYAPKPLLVAPGKTLQAALLFDPVATGVEEHDRRLPPSTLSTFQISAKDEKRNLFKSDDIIPAGFSEGARNLNAELAGSHGNMGDTNVLNGLGTLNFNFGVEFLNRLSDRDYLEKRALPDDPSMYVIHRSEQGMLGLYGTSSFSNDGVRDHVDQLAPARFCVDSQPVDCRRKESISEALDVQVERRTGEGRPALPMPDIPAVRMQYQDSIIPKPPSPAADSPAPSTWNPLFQQMTDAALNGDAQGIEMAGRAYAQSIEGQAWLGQGQQLNVALARQAEQEQQQAIQQVMAANEAQVQRGPAMRM
ncbi:MAG TPA: DUF2235 domain-containing protein [Pseudoxanthomonas sp.]